MGTVVIQHHHQCVVVTQAVIQKFTKLCLRNSGSATCISGTTHYPGFVGENNIDFGSMIGTLNNPFTYNRTSIPEVCCTYMYMYTLITLIATLTSESI